MLYAKAGSDLPGCGPESSAKSYQFTAPSINDVVICRMFGADFGSIWVGMCWLHQLSPQVWTAARASA